MNRHEYDSRLDATINAALDTSGINFNDIMPGTFQHNYHEPNKDFKLGTYRLPNLHLEDLQPAFLEGWTIPIGAHSDDKKRNVPLSPIEKPDANLPDVWNHPPATKMDGKCGITGVSNLLRLYGVEKNPGDIDTWSRRSWGPGMRVDKFAENMSELSGQTFNSCSIENGKEPLDVLKGYIKDKKPVAIMYMTGSTDAHWVVVTNVTETKDGPKLTVQSWGRYYEVPWKEIQYQWERGYGGPYPHVVADKPSEILKKVK